MNFSWPLWSVFSFNFLKTWWMKLVVRVSFQWCYSRLSRNLSLLRLFFMRSKLQMISEPSASANYRYGSLVNWLGCDFCFPATTKLMSLESCMGVKENCLMICVTMPTIIKGQMRSPCPFSFNHSRCRAIAQWVGHDFQKKALNWTCSLFTSLCLSLQKESGYAAFLSARGN